jgi:phage terminase large subunit
LTGKLEFNVSPVYLANHHYLYNTDYNILVNQGGTRSGKTYNIMIMLINAALCKPKYQVSVVAETVPHLKRGAMKDFLEIMQNHDIYEEKRHNKTDHIYTYGNKSTIEFFSGEDDGKVRGASRDLLFVNECNLVKQEVFRQLNLRTRWKKIIDYNPADEYHWIYDTIIPRDDAKFLKSTYLDNLMFLTKEQIREIERLKDEDPNAWKIYGEGERGVSQQKIFSDWGIISASQWPECFDTSIYGLDFGFTNPSALIFCGVKEKTLYLREDIYKTELTNMQLIDSISALGIDRNTFIIGDSAEPARIKEMFNNGLNVKEAIKGKDSVVKSIDTLKSFKIKINKESVNLIKEFRAYSWKVDKGGRLLDEPIPFNDHGISAARYAAYYLFGNVSAVPHFGRV